jgi:hypothetical protein
LKTQDYIKALYSLRCYQDGYSEGIHGMLAVAFAIRNRVRAGFYNGDWIKVLSHHKDWSATLEPYTEDFPDPRNHAFMMLLQEIDYIFAGDKEDDITRPKSETAKALAVDPPPVLYYAKLNEITNPKFLADICRRPDLHERIATVGALTFFT